MNKFRTRIIFHSQLDRIVSVLFFLRKSLIKIDLYFLFILFFFFKKKRLEICHLKNHIIEKWRSIKVLSICGTVSMISVESARRFHAERRRRRRSKRFIEARCGCQIGSNCCRIIAGLSVTGSRHIASRRRRHFTTTNRSRSSYDVCLLRRGTKSFTKSPITLLALSGSTRTRPAIDRWLRLPLFRLLSLVNRFLGDNNRRRRSTSGGRWSCWSCSRPANGEGASVTAGLG
jgi:hypothetical protein